MQQDAIVVLLFAVLILYSVILFGFIVFFTPWIHRAKQISYQNRFQRLKSEYDEALLTSQVEIQEQTIRSIGMELHDNICQKIYLTEMHVNELFPTKDSFDEKVPVIKNILGDTLKDLRGLLCNFSLELIKKGDLRKAMRGLVGYLQKSSVVSVRYQEQGVYEFLPDHIEIILFRMFQEAISNVINHAAARNIEILLDCDSNRIIIALKDDGTGFVYQDSPSVEADRPRMGLANMKARAALIDASLTIQTYPGSGTKIHILLPLKK